MLSKRVCNEYANDVIKRKEAKEKLGYVFDEAEDNVYYSQAKPVAPNPFEPQIEEIIKSLRDGKPDKYDLAKMRSSWLRHSPKPQLYLRGAQSNGHG